LKLAQQSPPKRSRQESAQQQQGGGGGDRNSQILITDFSKFPNFDRGQKSVILSITENVWPPCPAPALQDRQTDRQTSPLLPCLALQDGRTDTTTVALYI